MNHIWLYLAAIYPAAHLGLAVFVKYMPDPGETKSWYSAFYHGLAWFAVGNDKSK